LTSRELTGLLSRRDLADENEGSTSDWAWRLAFGAIGWPWLLASLWGGRQRDKRAMLAALDLPDDALPHLGSWKADVGFLRQIVSAIEELRPEHVVELGAGASTLIAAKAMQMNGGGRLHSFDQHQDFVQATADWLARYRLSADLQHAPLLRSAPGWPGRWYAISDLPDRIDLLIIDGPPWAVHPLVRGAAECLFHRLAPGGMVLLDDAARPGERIVARRWREMWPGFDFHLVRGGSKGTLVGRKQY